MILGIFTILGFITWTLVTFAAGMAYEHKGPWDCDMLEEQPTQPPSAG